MTIAGSLLGRSLCNPVTNWKAAFLQSLDPERETEESFEFGSTATEAKLSTLRKATQESLNSIGNDPPRHD